MPLVQRVQDILFKPKLTWPVIAQESADTASVYSTYLIYLAAIPALAGFIGLSLFTFIWASILSRAFQFMLVGFLFWKFGAPIKAFIDKYLAWLSAAFLVLVVGGFIAASMLTGGAHKSDKCSGATLTATR